MKSKRIYLKKYYKQHQITLRRRSREWLRAHPAQAKQTRKKYYARNREKLLRRAKQYGANHKLRHKRIARKCHLNACYNLTIPQFNKILAVQGGKCAICKQSVPGGRGTWHVDHDHACCPNRISCGKCIRGLLCAGCNAAIGWFNDSPEKLIVAVQYLRDARRRFLASGKVIAGSLRRRQAEEQEFRS